MDIKEFSRKRLESLDELERTLVLKDLEATQQTTREMLFIREVAH